LTSGPPPRAAAPPWRDLRLALDTSGPVGSVAVGDADGRVLASAVLPERKEHAARLLPAIHDVLGAAGARIADVDRVLVGEGPGSFTGVRVAGATAKGLAGALGCALCPVSSLLAAAWISVADTVPVPKGAEGPEARRLGLPGSPTVRYALFDARSERVYGACYRIASTGVEDIHPVHGGTLDEVLERAPPSGTVFVGEGAARHRARLESAGFRVAADAGEEHLAEGALGTALLASWARPVAPAAWEPRYVRVSGAERTWSV